MTQLSLISAPAISPRSTHQCDCGWRTSATAATARWLQASHLGDHEPDALVTIPAGNAFAAGLVLARAEGRASIVAPALGGDLALAKSFLRAAGSDGMQDHVLLAPVMEVLLETVREAAKVLQATSSCPEIAVELDHVLETPATHAAGCTRSKPAGITLSGRVPRLRPALSSAGTQHLADALGVLATPLLVALPSVVADLQASIAGQNVADLVTELAAIAPRLRTVENTLRAHLLFVQLNLWPMPLMSEELLDALADGVMEIHLARLAAVHYAELLGNCQEEAIAHWAQATTVGLRSRLSLLAEHAAVVLLELDADSVTD